MLQLTFALAQVCSVVEFAAVCRSAGTFLIPNLQGEEAHETLRRCFRQVQKKERKEGSPNGRRKAREPTYLSASLVGAGVSSGVVNLAQSVGGAGLEFTSGTVIGVGCEKGQGCEDIMRQKGIRGKPSTSALLR